jgi:hypothetical protein
MGSMEAGRPHSRIPQVANRHCRVDDRPSPAHHAGAVAYYVGDSSWTGADPAIRAIMRVA